MKTIFSKKELIEEIKKNIALYGNNCDLNHLNVFLIKDFSNLFSKAYKLEKFNGYIDNWVMSGAVNLNYMFADSEFNGDISKWDLPKLETARYMFANSKYNKNLINLSSTISLVDNYGFFENAAYNHSKIAFNINNENNRILLKQEINTEKILIHNRKHLISEIQNHISKYGNKCDLNHFNVSFLKNFSNIFVVSNDLDNFNGDISQWDVSEAVDMSSMFYYSSFNGNISNWDISNVRNMESMFYGSHFKSSINNWENKLNLNLKIKDMFELKIDGVCDWFQFNENEFQNYLNAKKEKQELIKLNTNSNLLSKNKTYKI